MRCTLHQLRHTRATELLEQGQRIEIVQRVLGHRDPRSPQGYADLTERQVRAALETRHPADE
jgi:site-specific recombinase XerD